MPAHDVIVIGASSGGVDALQRLVRDLSPDLPAALFVVLHIGAQPSVLPELLSRAGPLPAVHARDGYRPEQGRIYVAPPDHHLVLASGHMHVTRGPKENHARPSIDTLFRTAASAYGSRVVGVVLTGQLNDGTVGLWEVQRHGGVTVVQNPAEAAFPSMPQSALENVPIDYRVNVCQLAALLGLLASGTMEKRMETQPETSRDELRFSGLTCPECRGPLWHSEAGNSKTFQCRVGHRYSFDSLVEQHAATTEKTLWTAVLALEEAVILARQAARRALDPEAQQTWEREAQAKEKQAVVLREMLTQPDPAFQQASAGA